MMKEEDKEYWQQLNKAFLESSSQFDKQVLYFASGAFGLSFAFINDIVKLSMALGKWMLIAAWSSFVMVIILSIISHYTSLKAINHKIQNLNSKSDAVSKRLNSTTKWLNIMMIIFLTSGLILLTVFVAINL
jgi:hypothetical protein